MRRGLDSCGDHHEAEHEPDDADRRHQCLVEPELVGEREHHDDDPDV